MTKRIILAIACTTAACGGGDDGTAPMPDGGSDLPTGEMSIQLVSSYASVWHRPVVFYDPSGTAVAERETDEQGVASATAPAGSSISVGFRYQAATELVTSMGVQIGERVTLQLDDPNPATTTQVALTADPYAGAGGAPYTIRAVAGSVGASLSSTDPTATPFALYLDDIVNGTFDVYAEVTRSSDHARIAYTTSFDEDGTPGTHAVTLGDWQTAFDSLSIDVANAPALTDVAQSALVVDLFHGTRDLALGYGNATSGAGGDLVATAQLPHARWDAFQWLVGLQGPASAGWTRSTAYRARFTQLPGSVLAFDGAQLLPYLDAPNFDGRTITVATVGGGDLASATGIVIELDQPDADMALQPIQFVAAPAGASITLPVIAADSILADFAPATAARVQKITAVAGGSYLDPAAFRSHWFLDQAYGELGGIGLVASPARSSAAYNGNPVH